MHLRERGRDVFVAAVQGTRRKLRRGEMEVRIRKLAWDIDRQKAAIGQAIYPLLESGDLHVDLPEVHERIPRIQALTRRLYALRDQRVVWMAEPLPRTESEARWQNEGGRNTG